MRNSRLGFEYPPGVVPYFPPEYWSHAPEMAPEVIDQQKKEAAIVLAAAREHFAPALEPSFLEKAEPYLLVGGGILTIVGLLALIRR